MKGYKAFHKGLTAHGGFQYEIDKEYTITGELKMCANGFHFCRNLIDVFGYYSFDEETVEVAEVEASGQIINEGTKYCAEKIKIIEMVPWTDIYGSIIDKNHNTGKHNSGSYNSGSYNSGNCNSGNYNSGDYNWGNANAGDHNRGGCNVGDYNRGSCNTGSHNSGSYNTGSYNSGSHNTGSYNSGRCNSGFFNTNKPTVRLFNKDSGMTFEEFDRLRINMHDLEESKSIIQTLPNFDAQIFYEATGIDWREEVKDD